MKFAVVLALFLGVPALSVDCTTADRSLLFGAPPLGATEDLTLLIAAFEGWNAQIAASCATQYCNPDYPTAPFPTTAEEIWFTTSLSCLNCGLTGIALACVAFAVC